ncbi:MAG: response regulator [Nitrospirae bacterium]|nr:response regulator [Nitrospirota bacterium]
MMSLEGHGYKGIESEDGDTAVKRFIENNDSVSLLLLDVIMPSKNGRDAYEEIKRIRPDIKAIFMSGYTDDIIAKKGVLQDSVDFIAKPIDPDALLRKIRTVLDR